MFDKKEYQKQYYIENKEVLSIKQKSFNTKRNDYQKTSDVAKNYRSDYYKYYKKAKALDMTVAEYKNNIVNNENIK